MAVSVKRYDASPKGTDLLPFFRGNNTAAKVASVYDVLGTYKLNHFDNVTLDNVSDDAPGFQAALRYIQEQGGGTLEVPPSVSRWDSYVNAHDDISEFSKPVRIIGSGANKTGRFAYDMGGSIINLHNDVDVDNPLGYALYARNNGSLDMMGLSFVRKEGTGIMIYIMNTTVIAHYNSFISEVGGDVFVLGGNTEAGLGPITDDTGFQGYGTDISFNYFNGIWTGIRGQTYANAVTIMNNTFWNACGNTSDPKSCAIWFGNTDLDGTEENAGGTIIGNLIEMHSGYKYGIVLEKSIGFTVIGNNCFDPHASSVASVYCGPLSKRNEIIPGFYPYPPYGNIVAVIDESIAQNNRWPGKPERVYANDAAADADATLLPGQYYQITGSRALYQKP